MEPNDAAEEARARASAITRISSLWGEWDEDEGKCNAPGTGPEVEMLEKICASSGPTRDLARSRQRNCPVESSVEDPVSSGLVVRRGLCVRSLEGSPCNAMSVPTSRTSQQRVQGDRLKQLNVCVAVA